MIANLLLSQRIRHYRKMHAMTQEELAAEIGVESVHIANIEGCRRGISLDKLVQICRCFHISLSDILPIDVQDDSALKNKWIDEITNTLDLLDISQLSVVRSMVCSLDSSKVL